MTTSKQIKKILDDSFWPETLQTEINYQRVHDDCDGVRKGSLNVYVDTMGDVWFTCDVAHQSLRFRTWGGGGMSLRVRNALLILAEAIRLDNEGRPQKFE